jgi:MoxR-like ATPase
MQLDEAQFREQLTEAHEALERVRREVAHAVVGQQVLVDRLLIALLVRGHLLIEGVPGLAKTLAVKTLAATLDASFKRVQFTPDLLPADITGTQIFDPAGGRFNARLGPIFANLVLADEINRAPAKVQSALLEAMQERQVTIGDTTYPLPEPFVVIATQNPIEQEGTYNLPEAQVDRFLMKVLVDYPTRDEEAKMLSLYLDPVGAKAQVSRVLNLTQIAALSRLASSVHVDERITRYIVDLVQTTRDKTKLGANAAMIAFGASPRATLSLAHVAKAHAFLNGRGYVLPDDVKAMAHDVLRHRVLLTYEAVAEELTVDQLIDHVLKSVPVP